MSVYYRPDVVVAFAHRTVNMAERVCAFLDLTVNLGWGLIKNKQKHLRVTDAVQKWKG